ncbi:MAG: tRNA uridine-5-carboxymethylaminomethyl(34) synthesis GTPase MnmE [wastewater metagenome]|nr:tRNA uridine-5-carboxymethylaminomethyl(34) synthesis GTPase MnmE [Candidatus Loosdrechtia aerotolerans]
MFPETQDTIVAASTPSGKSLCAIIRISGPEAIPCIKDIFVPASKIDLEQVPSYSSIRGHIHIVDEHTEIPVSLYIMRRPYSYTKEDVVEIHTPGTPIIVEMLLDLIVTKNAQTKRGVRLSQPGEFTKRAFLHGRIDLAQAEAVMRVIRAQTDRELTMALAQLEGDVSRKIRQIQDDMVLLCSHIEAAIDFSDQDIELITPGEMVKRLEIIEENISGLLTESEPAKISPEGVHTIFYGKPNVGKSSLINTLLGRKRSIVCDIPGTTRDSVADTLEIDNIRFHLRDTAGVEDDAGGIVLARAVERTQSMVKRAEIVLLVFDSDSDITGQLRDLELEDITGRVIVVFNKCDLQERCSSLKLPDKLRGYPFVHTSAVTGQGMEELKKALKDCVLGGHINRAGDPSLCTVRQKEALRHSLHLVQQAGKSARDEEGFEFIALNMRAAIDTLGEIIGVVTTEDILGTIFSEFCIGK